jgi:hypothetical protein
VTIPRRFLLGAVVCAVLAAGAAGVLARPAQATVRPTARTATATRPAPVRHVVIVGVSGLRWNEVSAARTPTLWRMAEDGSVGSLVDYAEYPFACPADGWLTLNSGARSAGTGPCGTLPAVVPGPAGSARIPEMPRLIAHNAQFHQNPDWGLLGRLGGCATAVGPGAALALAAPSGAVSDYIQAPSGLSARVLARCPLTVVDLAHIPVPALSHPDPERPVPAAVDHVLSRIVDELAPGTLVLVTAPGGGRQAGEGGPGAGQGAAVGTPHLMTTVVSGPGYAGGLLTAASTRRPGIVALTDLTPTVAHWLGQGVPGYLTGSVIARGDQNSLSSAIRTLRGRDTAEQVWMATHAWFLVGYAVADVIAFGMLALVFRGRDEKHRRRRAAGWRTAGVFAAAVPAGTFLAGLVPWWEQSHPVAWLYGLAAAWTLVLGCAVLAAERMWPRRRLGCDGAIAPDREMRWRQRANGGAFGQICLLTLILLGVDVMTGSWLQLETPFGLSLAEGGRYYGIGNNALGVYCVSALVAAVFPVFPRGLCFPGGCVSQGAPPPSTPHGGLLAPHTPSGRGKPSRFASRRWARWAVARASVVGVFAVVASGWPGFGAKVGGTIAMVPCFVLLILALAGVRVRWRYAGPVALSGLALFAVFAIVSYILPAAGVSDIGSFAGNLLHGHGGAVLERKASSNLGTLTASAAAPLVPVAMLALGLALWRPELARLRMVALAFESQPLLRVTAWLTWLVLMLGWFADDSGVMVPAAAMPFAVPLLIAMSASVFFAVPESAILKEPSPGLPSQASPRIVE